MQFALGALHVVFVLNDEPASFCRGKQNMEEYVCYYFYFFLRIPGSLRDEMRFHCTSEKSEHEAVGNSSVIHIPPTSRQKPNVFQYALYHWCREEGGALLVVFHCVCQRV